jgi:hypothetical protein
MEKVALPRVLERSWIYGHVQDLYLSLHACDIWMDHRLLTDLWINHCLSNDIWMDHCLLKTIAINMQRE